MRISFERSGGFAGMTLRRTVDTDELPPDEAERVRGLVEGADFFALPAAGAAGRGADRFQYVVEVEHAGRRHAVQVGEDAPPGLQPLLDYLTRLARKPGTGR